MFKRPERKKNRETEIQEITKTKDAVDNTLVETAYKDLSEIFSQNYENAMIQSGKYIIEKFYNSKIALARKNKPVKSKSLLELIKKLQTRSETTPSKSWIYNAVNLVVDTEDFKNFHTYGKLMLSHKVLLFTVSNRKDKEKLITDAVENNYTINQLKEKIAELKIAESSEMSLPKLISHPEALFKDDTLISIEKLKTLSEKEIETVEKRVKSKIGSVQMGITSLESKLKEQNEYLEKYKEFIENIGTIKTKNRSVNRN